MLLYIYSRTPGSAKKDSTARGKKKHSFDLAKKKRKKQTSMINSDSSATVNCGIWGERVPLELLLNIFQYVVDSSGSLPFLCRWVNHAFLVFVHVPLEQESTMFSKTYHATSLPMTAYYRNTGALKGGLKCFYNNCPNIRTYHLEDMWY